MSAPPTGPGRLSKKAAAGVAVLALAVAAPAAALAASGSASASSSHAVVHAAVQRSGLVVVSGYDGGASLAP